MEEYPFRYRWEYDEDAYLRWDQVVESYDVREDQLYTLLDDQDFRRHVRPFRWYPVGSERFPRDSVFDPDQLKQFSQTCPDKLRPRGTAKATQAGPVSVVDSDDPERLQDSPGHDPQILDALIDRVFERVDEDGQILTLPDNSASEGRPDEWPSKAMHAVTAQADRIVGGSTTVLLLGETGVGKGYLARLIHERSQPARPFIERNSADFAHDMAESKLFGHEKGAFTGAISRHIGICEQVGDGTLFLDEIAEMPLYLQARLLTFLGSRSSRFFQRLGGKENIEFKARIMTATNKVLENEVAAGRFREDLLYRISVYRITVPPLRERKEDIPKLAANILAGLYGGSEKSLMLHRSVLHALYAHDWPGNVRELKNVLERSKIECEGDCIRPEHVVLGSGEAAAKVKAPKSTDKLHGTSPEMLQAMLDQGMSRAGMARILGCGTTTLKTRLKKEGFPDGEAGRPEKESKARS
jgi:DNA-binding NtrC family response regulator